MKGQVKFLLGLCISFVLLFFSYKFYLKKLPFIRVLQIELFGDIAVNRVLNLFKVQFVPQLLLNFKCNDTANQFKPTWAFRPSHAVPTYPIPLVGDADKDGVPEIYIGSNTREVTTINGKNHSILWQWKLPFGIVGARVMALSDLDNDGKEELLVGSHTSLPIRLYALRTQFELPKNKRLLWFVNTQGDFLEGGLNLYDSSNEKYILTSTRDAPYSRGSIQVINAKGKLYYKPIDGIDNCVSRPPIGTIGKIKSPVFINGNHNYYNPKWGNQFTARKLFTGELVWATPKIGDGGYLNHQIVDIDFDLKNEVLINFQDSTKKIRHWILDGNTGVKIKEFNYDFQASLVKEHKLLVSRNDTTFCLNETGISQFKLPKIDFGFENDLIDQLLLFRVVNKNDSLMLFSYDGMTGKQLSCLTTRYNLPKYNEIKDYGIFGVPSEKVTFLTLADTDNNGYWDILVQIRDFIVNVSIPYKVGNKVNRYALQQFRNIDNRGIIYR